MTGLAPFAQRLAGKLSGGMKQKLGLACTLVRTPELLILDEPTAGVDPLSRRELWEILKDLVEGGHISVLVSTAYMEEAELCDEVYILNKGKVLDRGTPEELRKETEGRCRMAKTPEGIPPRVLQAAFLDDWESVEDAVPEKGNVRFVLKEGVPLERVKAFSCYPRLETESVPSRLEDSFMCCLGKLERKESPLKGFELDYKEPAHISGKVDIEVKIWCAGLVISPLWTIHHFRFMREKSSGFWGRTAQASRQRLKCFADFFPQAAANCRWQG